MKGYRPHLRVPIEETMLGVEFIDPDGVVPAGIPIAAVARLVYSPVVSYSALQPGTSIEVVEGSRVVAHGRVSGLRLRLDDSIQAEPIRG